MKTRPLFKTILFALLFMLIGGQWAWADGPLSKKDSLELVKAIQEYKKSEKKATTELNKKLKNETDSLKAENIANNGNYEIDKLLVDFITEHPKLMDLSDKQLEKLLNIGVYSSTDGRIRYYAWTVNQYDDYDDVSRVMQYRTNDGQVKVCWNEPFYNKTYAPWGYAFIPMEIYTLDNNGKRVYLVKEIIKDAVYSWEQLRAIAMENGKMVDVPIFDCKDICNKTYDFSIYADYFNPEDEFVLPTQITSTIGFCQNDTAMSHNDDYVFDSAVTYDPTKREIYITLSCNDELRENIVMKYDDKRNLFVLRTFPPTTDPTEIAVGQRVKAIMEDALNRFNQEEAASQIDDYQTQEEYNEKYTAALEKAQEAVGRLDYDYCTEGWNTLRQKVNNVVEQREDYFPDSGIWISGQELSDGPNMKFLCIDKIHKIDNNTYLVYYTFRRYLHNNVNETATVTMVRERGNWYIDDFGATENGGGWKEEFHIYLNETWE